MPVESEEYGLLVVEDEIDLREILLELVAERWVFRVWL